MVIESHLTLTVQYHKPQEDLQTLQERTSEHSPMRRTETGMKITTPKFVRIKCIGRSLKHFGSTITRYTTWY